MIHHKYGHCSIKLNGVEYIFTPSFYNISKISEDPKDIINIYIQLVDESPLYVKFSAALHVLSCCCDKSLAEDLTGYIDDNLKHSMEEENPYRMISLIQVAQHLMKHGVSGDFDFDSIGDKDAVQEFDPYHYIEMAVEKLGVSVEEASKMSMTQFVRSIWASSPELYNSKGSNVRVINGVRYERFEI